MDIPNTSLFNHPTGSSMAVKHYRLQAERIRRYWLTSARSPSSRHANDSLAEMRQQFIGRVSDESINAPSVGSAGTTSTSRKELLSAHDRELERVESLIWSLLQDMETIHAELSRKRNSQTAAHELPDDILRMIFNLCCQRDRRPDGTYFKMSGNVILEVCSRWYTVAMDNAAMWSSIDMDILGVPQAKRYLKRSGGHEKRIMFTEHPYQHHVDSQIFRLLGQHMESVVELDVTLAPQAIPVFWLNTRLSVAPILHTLSLRFSQSSVNSSFVDLSGFRRKAPNLRYLDFEGVLLLWESEPYRNLTTLRISGCTASSLNGALPPNDILAPLRGSPELQELEFSLKGLWKFSMDPEIDLPQGRLSLASLRVLRVSLPSPYLCRFLSALDIPGRLATLDLTVVPHDSQSIANVESHISPVPLFLPGILPPKVLDGSACVQLHSNIAENIEDDIRFSGYHRGTPFDVHISWRQIRKDPRQEVLQAILEHYPLPAVHSFDFVAGEDITLHRRGLPHNLDAFMVHLSGLSHLRITAPHERLSEVFTQMAVRRFPHLSSIEVFIPRPHPVSVIRSTWLPSLQISCPNIARFVVTFKPFFMRQSSETAYSTATRMMLERQELEHAARAYPSISICVYAGTREPDGSIGLAQLWPIVPTGEEGEDRDPGVAVHRDRAVTETGFRLSSGEYSTQ